MEPSLYHFFKGKNLNSEMDSEQQKQQISSFIKRSLSSNNLSIFIGSGCSVPAIPLMSKTMSVILEDNKILELVKKYLELKSVDLFKEYLSNRKTWDEVTEKEIEEIELVECLIKNNNFTLISELHDEKLTDKTSLIKYLDFFYRNYSDIESLLNWLQNGINFNPKDKELLYAFETIKSKFIETIPSLKSEGSDKYDGNVFEIFRKFYKHVFEPRNAESPKVSIFTTNYDLFNEKGLEANNIFYTTGFTSNLQKKFDINQFKYRLVDDTNRYKDRWQPISKEANLYKIHGSINWKTMHDGELYQVEDNPNNESVVIYPTMLKHKETSQAPYSELFREFSNALQKKNTTLIVMGYGFPDEHINTIISQNLKNQDFTLIIFGDNTEKKMLNFYEEHKNSNLHFIGGDTSDKQKGHHFEVIVDEFLDYVPTSNQQGENSDE